MNINFTGRETLLTDGKSLVKKTKGSSFYPQSTPMGEIKKVENAVDKAPVVSNTNGYTSPFDTFERKTEKETEYSNPCNVTEIDFVKEDENKPVSDPHFFG